MAPRTVFATLQDGLQQMSLFDQMFAITGQLGITPCSAAGTNAVALTPLPAANAPNVTAYTNYLQFSFVAANSSTITPVTISVAGLPALNLYQESGSALGSLVANTFYVIAYGSTLNSGAGGWYTVEGTSGGGGGSGGANIRPTNETSYTVQLSDNGLLVIANSSTAVTWTLPVFYPFSFYAVNRGTAPLFIVPSSATVNGISKLCLTDRQGSIVTSDGSNYLAQAVLAPDDGVGSAKEIVSFDTFTTGPVLTLAGTVTTGDTVGFNFSATSPSFNIPFRYTYLAGDTLGTAAQNLITQFIANSTVIANLGDARFYANAHPNGTGGWVLGFDSLYPFSSTSGQVFTAFASGGATSSITPSSTSASNSLEATGWLGLGRSARYAGREPAAGDGLAAIFVSGDVVGTSINQNSFQPIYGDLLWSILNPNPGVASALLRITTDTLALLPAGTWGAGHGVGIGTPTPDSLLHIVTSASGVGPTPTAGTALHVAGPDSSPGYITLDAFGTGTPASLLLRGAAGTAASPTHATSGSALGGISVAGYGSGGYNFSAAMSVLAEEDFSGSAAGTKWIWTTTPNTTLTPVIRLTINNAGNFAAGAHGVSSSGGSVAFFDINPSAAATGFPNTAPPILRVLGVDGSPTLLAFQNYGSQNQFASYLAGGTAASPTAVTNTTTIFNIQGLSYDGTVFGNGAGGSNVAIQFRAAELQASGFHGTLIALATTPTGTTSRVDALTVQASGGISVGTVSDPGTGTIFINNATYLIRTKTSFTNGAAAGSGTLTNAPTAGNPTKWIAIDDNGTTRQIPAW